MLRALNESDGDARVQTHTVRQRIVELLRSSELTTHEISRQASVAERDVAEHLRHLEHSLLHSGERLHVLAPHCVKCDFAFDNREKHGRPSRCPRCKSERVSKARFSVVPGSRSA
jgi:transcriptional regulator